MIITLEMLEEVMKRTGADFDQAKAALQENEGSVEAAVASFLKEDEEKKGFEKAVDDTLRYVKEMAEKGLLSRLVITNKDETILNIPLGVGVFGLVFAGFFTVAGLTAAFLADYQVKVVTKDNKDINLNAYMEKAKEKVSKVVKDHTEEEYVIFSEEEDQNEDKQEKTDREE
jgi:predicted polyphosphate/ATP-dependent NAD kinase